VRRTLFTFLQLLAMAAVGLMAYGLVLVLAGSLPKVAGVAAGIAAAGAVYLGAVRGKPAPWGTRSDLDDRPDAPEPPPSPS
jgi:hypothetical protein